MDVHIRFAEPDDAATLLRFIRELAEYEREPGAVEATEPGLRAQLASDRPPFECLLAERGDEALGFALFFQSYSTWKGRPGMWLEDLFVLPYHRRQGVARALLGRLGLLCRERGYGRLDLSVLDWNELGASVYREVGAVSLDEWTTWRVTGPALARLGGS